MNFSVSNTVCSTILFVLFSLVCPVVLRRYSIKAFTQFSKLVALVRLPGSYLQVLMSRLLQVLMSRLVGYACVAAD